MNVIEGIDNSTIVWVLGTIFFLTVLFGNSDSGKKGF